MAQQFWVTLYIYLFNHQIIHYLLPSGSALELFFEIFSAGACITHTIQEIKPHNIQCVNTKQTSAAAVLSGLWHTADTVVKAGWQHIQYIISLPSFTCNITLITSYPSSNYCLHWLSVTSSIWSVKYCSSNLQSFLEDHWKPLAKPCKPRKCSLKWSHVIHHPISSLGSTQNLICADEQPHFCCTMTDKYETKTKSLKKCLYVLCLYIFRVTTLQTMWNTLTIPWQLTALLCGTRHVKCYSYHPHTSTKYLYGCKYAAYNKQF